MLPGVFEAKKKSGEVYYRASITKYGKHVSLGSFPTEKKAHKAYEEACRIYEDERINILIRDLGDEAVLQELAELHPRIIVDDASHLWSHQIKAFFALFPSLPSGGIYIMEDLETSLSMNLPGLENDYADYPIDAYTICERVMRVAASKVPDSTPDEYAANVTAIGMAVEMGVTIKGSCVFIKR